MLNLGHRSIHQLQVTGSPLLYPRHFIPQIGPLVQSGKRVRALQVSIQSRFCRPIASSQYVRQISNTYTHIHTLRQSHQVDLFDWHHHQFDTFQDIYKRTRRHTYTINILLSTNQPFFFLRSSESGQEEAILVSTRQQHNNGKGFR